MTEDPHPHGEVESLIPPMIVGARSVSMWLQGIGIRASDEAVVRVRRERRIAIKRLASDPRTYVYTRRALKDMIRAMTGVDAECWMAKRDTTTSDFVVRVPRFSIKKNGVIYNTAPPANSARIYVALANLCSPGHYIHRELIICHPKNRRPYCTTDPVAASRWDLSWWPGSWRLMEYRSILPAMDPCLSVGKYASPSRHAGRVLLVAYHLDPMDGKGKVLRVPASLLGWESITFDVPCAFPPSVSNRRAIALYARRKTEGSPLWWWIWANSREVRPITLDPMPSPEKTIRRALASIPTKPHRADEVEIVNDLIQEPDVPDVDPPGGAL